MIDWYPVALSLLPDDPWATAPRIIAHLSVARVQTLGRNLAIAGALCSSFNLGYDRGEAIGEARSRIDLLEARADTWKPNIDGKVAP